MSLSANVVVSAMSVISVSILFRSLAAAEVGIWVFFLSSLTLIETFRAGFISTAFVKFYSGASKQRAAEVLGSSWFLAFMITGAVLLLNAVAFFVPISTTDIGISLFLQWFGINFLVNLPSFIATVIQQAEFRFDRIFYIRLINQGSFITFLLILVGCNLISLPHIFYAYLLSAALTSIFCLCLGWAKPHMIKHQRTSCIKEIFTFGKYSLGTNIGTNLFHQSDTFIITFTLGPAALAVYNLAKRFMEIVEMPLRSFVATGISNLSAYYNQGNNLDVVNLLKKNAGILTLCLAPAILFTFAFAEIPIALIGGEKYLASESANLLRIFMVLSILSPIDRFVAVTTDVINKPKVNFIKVLIMLGINVLGNIGGILLLGNIYGVAFASIPTNLFGFIFGFYLFNKYFPIPLTISGILTHGYREGSFMVKQMVTKTIARVTFPYKA